MILADRGFTIQHSTGLDCAEVCIPLAKVSSAKWRVKRLINYHMHVYILNRNFHLTPISIMASTDDDGVSFIDKIDIVCCVL